MFDFSAPPSGGGGESAKKKKVIRPPGMGQVIGTEMRELDAFHLKRVEASLLLQGVPEAEAAPLAIRALLNDISEQGTAIYAPKSLHLGLSGKLQIPEPKAIELGVQVVWCQELERPRHVLTAQTFPYRIGVKFLFEGGGADLEQFRQFCEELARIYPGTDLTGAPYFVRVA